MGRSVDELIALGEADTMARKDEVARFFGWDRRKRARGPEDPRAVYSRAEEIEHQETVFKLLQSVSRSWWLRAFGLALSAATFLGFLALGTLMSDLLHAAADPRVLVEGRN